MTSPTAWETQVQFPFSLPAEGFEQEAPTAHLGALGYFDVLLFLVLLLKLGHFGLIIINWAREVRIIL